MATKCRGYLGLIVVLVTSVSAQESQTSSRSANTQYFPAGVFEIDRVTSRGAWYSHTLRALQEPSIFAVRTDKSFADLSVPVVAQLSTSNICSPNGQP